MVTMKMKRNFPLKYGTRPYPRTMMTPTMIQNKLFL